MASQGFDRWFFSLRGLRAEWAKWQLRFERPLLGAQLRQQVYGFYPGNQARKEQAYQRVKSAFGAGLSLTEAPAGEALFIRSIPVYGAAGAFPGLPERRFVYETRSRYTVSLADGTSLERFSTVTVTSDESLTVAELQTRIRTRLFLQVRRGGSPPVTEEVEDIQIQQTKVEWVIRRY